MDTRIIIKNKRSKLYYYYYLSISICLTNRLTDCSPISLTLIQSTTLVRTGEQKPLSFWIHSIFYCLCLFPVILNNHHHTMTMMTTATTTKKTFVWWRSTMTIIIIIKRKFPSKRQFWFSHINIIFARIFHNIIKNNENYLKISNPLKLFKCLIL